MRPPKRKRFVSLAMLGAFATATTCLAFVAAGCGGVEVSELPLREDFAECAGFTMNDEVATVDCPEGELRVLVSQPEVSPIHFVPLRFDTRSSTLVVSAEARAPVPGGSWGVGCLASGPGEPGRGYALLIGRGGEAGILRIDQAPSADGENGRFAQQFEVITGSQTGVQFIVEPSARHELRIRCTEGAAGVVRIRASVDGGNELAATDRRGIAPFTAAFPIVVTDRPRTDVRFDNLVAVGAA